MGTRTKIKLGLDSVAICIYKIVRKPRLAQKSKKEEELVLRIPLKIVNRIEKAIYNSKKLYIWYEEKKRIDIEFKKETEIAKVLSKGKFLLKKINLR